MHAPFRGFFSFFRRKRPFSRNKTARSGIEAPVDRISDIPFKLLIEILGCRFGNQKNMAGLVYANTVKTECLPKQPFQSIPLDALSEFLSDAYGEFRLRRGGENYR